MDYLIVQGTNKSRYVVDDENLKKNQPVFRILNHID